MAPTIHIHKLWLLSAACVLAMQVAAEAGRAVVVMAPSVSLSDLRSMPNLRRVAASGGCAVMTSRIGKLSPAPFIETEPDDLAASYLTLASGSRAAAGEGAAAVVDAVELYDAGTAGEVWGARQGRPAATSGLVAPGMVREINQNATASYDVPIGELGRRLSEAGIAGSVVGTADDPGSKWRDAGLFVLGTDGRAPEARLTKGRMIRDPASPFGVRSDTGETIRLALEAMRDDRLVLVEPGDLARLCRYQQQMLAEARARTRLRCLRQTDEVVGAITKALPSDMALVVVAPSPAPDQETLGADRLALMVVYWRGMRPGLLVSASTRRQGVVANTDFASTLLDLLGVGGVVGGGKPARATPYADNLVALERLADEARFQERSRPVVLFAVYVAAALVAASSAAAAAAKKPGAAKAAAAAVAGFFIGILAASYWMPSPQALAAAFLATGALVAAAAWRGSKWTPEAVAAAAAAAVTLAWASGLLARAAGSYDIQGGGRFYGIGNEYSGFLIGAALTLAASPALIRRKQYRVAAVALALGVALFVGHPQGGANAGDMLATLLAVGVYAAIVFCRHPLRAALASAGAAVVVLGAVAVWDASRPAASRSHLGNAVALAKAEGTKALADIVVRKAELNWMLVRHSPWMWLLGACAAGSAAVLLRIKVKREHLPRLWTLGAATLALFVLNDSGVLGGACCGVWLFFACIFGLDCAGGGYEGS